jgi:L-alanine-DL-glutamate epimerase-like enolase superfamily enzyme
MEARHEMTNQGTSTDAAGRGTETDIANLTIVDVQTLTFRYRSHVGKDIHGHGHPAPEHEATHTLTRIRTSIGLDGYFSGGSAETAAVANRMISGMNPLDRETIWYRLLGSQRLERRAMDDRNLAAIDCALWDFAGRLTGLPVSKLLGSSRTSLPAYASSMCGDDIPGGLDSPEAYADFAASCQALGYPAFKLHTWMSPYGPDLERDIAACRAVRDRVGPDMKLMLDPHHDYTREEALYLGRALEELDFYWMEEPMNEHSTSSYVWLTERLDLQIVGPETAHGQMYTRAEWILRGAADILRVGVADVGGITPSMKTVHLCEAFRMRCEVHGGGSANLQVLGAMGIPGEFYERGLLHPHVDHDAQSPWLKTPIDAIDEHGFVQIPQRPGLGDDFDWDFIRDNTVSGWG